MLTYKITGVDEMVDRLRKMQLDLPTELIDKAVKKASLPVKNRLVEAYKHSFAQTESGKKYLKSFKLANSIDTFQRKRRGKDDPYFTYYVGPRWSTKETAFLGIGGGNAAYWMEYGTQERFRANVKAGGIGKTTKGKKTGLKGVYGAKISTGRIPGYGIVRRTSDEMAGITMEGLKRDVFDAILTAWEERGGKTFKK